MKSLKLTTREILIIVIAAVVLVAGLTLERKIIKKPIPDTPDDSSFTEIIYDNDDNMEVNVATLREIATSAKELVAYKYRYMDCGEYEKSEKWFNSFGKVPFTTDKTVFIYKGTINAGVDLELMEIEVDDKGKVIDISLPQPKIISHEIDKKNGDFLTYNVKNGLTSTSMNEYMDFLNGLEERQEEKLADDQEFWQEVKESIKDTLTNLLVCSKTTANYEVNITWRNS